MKFGLFTGMLLSSISSVVLADPVSLTVNKALELAGALQAVNAGYQKHSLDKDGKDVAMQMPYVFSGLTLLSIARDEAAVDDAVAPAQKSAKALFDRLADPKTRTVPPEHQDEYTTQVNAIGDQTINFDFYKISTDDLKLGSDAGQNPIPPSVLAALLPIIK